jgi:hypothetical protein
MPPGEGRAPVTSDDRAGNRRQWKAQPTVPSASRKERTHRGGWPRKPCARAAPVANRPLNVVVGAIGRRCTDYIRVSQLTRMTLLRHLTNGVPARQNTGSRFAKARDQVISEPPALSPPLGSRAAPDPLHHLDHLGPRGMAGGEARAPARPGDAPPDRSRGLVELTPASRRQRTRFTDNHDTEHQGHPAARRRRSSCHSRRHC